jgi:hypothetical protein
MESLGWWFLGCCLRVLTIGNRTAITSSYIIREHNKNPSSLDIPLTVQPFKTSAQQLDQQTKSHPSLLLNYLSDGEVGRNEKNEIKT